MTGFQIFVAALCAAIFARTAHAERVPTTNPTGLSSRAVIAPPDEPGERMRISGSVFARDGKTPVEGVVIYVYHTNSRGRYDMRHGDAPDTPQFRLQAWMRTDARGNYEFETIKPGAYPNDRIPAHIHVGLTPPNGRPDWASDYVFEGDPHLNDEHRRQSFVVHLKREPGMLVGARDFVLKDD